MRIAQAIGILVALLAGVFLIGGQLLPSKLVVVRQGELCQAPARVFEALSNPAEIASWSLFTREADLPATHNDVNGPGGWVRWTGDDGDVIEWRIREAEPPNRVAYGINLDDSFMVSASGHVEPAPDGGSGVRLSLRLEPESIPGRWAMMLTHWTPGGQSLGDVLDMSIGHLSDFLDEEAGACEADPDEKN